MPNAKPGLEFGGWGLGFRVSVSKFRVQSSSVSSSDFVSGVGCRADPCRAVQCGPEHENDAWDFEVWGPGVKVQ